LGIGIPCVYAVRILTKNLNKMDIEKYKAELEAAIYEGSDGRFYIGGNVIDKVLKEVQSQALRIHDVVGRSEQLKAFNCVNFEDGHGICETQCDYCKRVKGF
jgi:hypothetical protein